VVPAYRARKGSNESSFEIVKSPIEMILSPMRAPAAAAAPVGDSWVMETPVLSVLVKIPSRGSRIVSLAARKPAR
jgi:hypothetical protein